MRSPFPGMDPYLEHPALWPDFHNSLLAAIRDDLSPVLRPRYYVAVEERIYHFTPDDLLFIGIPDLSVVQRQDSPRPGPQAGAETAVLEVEVPLAGEVRDTFLEVREAVTGNVVTVLELLSPANKLHRKGREDYEAKRQEYFTCRTSLVEVDLLRAGEPMPLVRKPPRSDYRILVSRGYRRPRAHLYRFGVRQPIPAFPLPLLRDDPEPQVDLNAILHALYERASYDLRLDYTKPPAPPLGAEDADWARGLAAP
jgi:hypothetical protein